MPMHAHKLVADVAIQFAQGLYEEMAKDNLWYALNKDRNVFVKQVAPMLLEEARQTLTDMLTRPDVPDRQKDEIYQALVDDLGLPRGGVSVTAH